MASSATELDDSRETSCNFPVEDGAGVAVVKPKSLRRSWLVCLAGALNISALWGNFFSYGVILVPLLCDFQAGRAITGRAENSELNQSVL